MKQKTKKQTWQKIGAALGLLLAFIGWTAAICVVDVQPIGPRNSLVGFAALNGFFYRLTGTHLLLYTITDWLGLVPLAVALCFAILGLAQWIHRKRLLKVDADILALGVFYLIVIAAYILFEMFAINYRPVLLDGYLEASYPSSTTLLTLCVMPTAILQLKRRLRSRALSGGVSCVIAAFTAFMVLGRTIAGVHWLTDILGGVLLSAGLVLLYAAVAEALCPQQAPAPKRKELNEQG